MTALLLLALIASVIFLVVFFVQLRRVSSENMTLHRQLDEAESHYAATVTGLQTRVEALSKDVERLSPWQGIADVAAEAQRIRTKAESMYREAVQKAKEVVGTAERKAQQLIQSSESSASQVKSTAEADAKSIVEAAKSEAKEISSKAEIELESATSRANSLIQEAEIKAKEIAGGAYDVMKKADLYEKTARAMRNTIKGYGDEYLIPSHSLLDDLAESFEHKEAGAHLKAARQATRQMVKNKSAAVCDYVETSRRDTAIQFVVDAFNGKVDSILSRVKHDNAGKLEQEIRDAFNLVNFNGKAFKDARITETYLMARLDELKWAAVAHQLRLEEREEQRLLREQIREEEKARKEFERAIRDAAKEEEMLKKAMTKAREQLLGASLEQKQAFERQINELNQKLQEAEEKNQRAISMAQQTRCGHVYIISNIGSFGEDVFKIGLTRRLEPLDRVKELGDSSVPFEFDVHALIYSEDAPALERELHKHFVMAQMNKVNHRKEFFRVSIGDIREEIENLGHHAKWTMLAEAREFRETKAIESKIENDETAKSAWLERQLVLDPTDLEEEAIGAK